MKGAFIRIALWRQLARLCGDDASDWIAHRRILDWAILPAWARKYLTLLAFGAVPVLAVLALWSAQNLSGQLAWYTAFLLGFSSEAALEKLLQRPAVP